MTAEETNFRRGGRDRRGKDCPAATEAASPRICQTVVPSEADTFRKFVVPLLQPAGWDTEPHSTDQQRMVTDGKIAPVAAEPLGPRFETPVLRND